MSNKNEKIDFWQELENYMQAVKASAITQYRCSDIPKQELISGFVGSLVMNIISKIDSGNELYQRWEAEDDYISANMILDTMPDYGVLIGSAAYRLIEQLEIELQGNPIEGNLEIKFLLDCYFRYFRQDDRGILNQMFYCHNLLTKPENKTEMTNFDEVVESLLGLPFINPSSLIIVHHCMRNLYKKKPIRKDVNMFCEICKDAEKKIDNNDANALAGNKLCIEYCKKIINLIDEG